MGKATAIRFIRQLQATPAPTPWQSENILALRDNGPIVQAARQAAYG
jgi:hypothetical protein